MYLNKKILLISSIHAIQKRNDAMLQQMNYIQKNPIFFYLIYGFVMFFCIALSKTVLGPDEQTYLEVGNIFFDTGIYTYPKAHPLLSLLSALIYKLTNNSLLTYQLIYGFSGMILSISIYKILTEIISIKKYVPYVHLFVLINPGILLLCLYSISNLVFTSIAYASVLVLYLGCRKNSNMLIAISGILVGLSYMTRLDGLVIFFIIVFFLIVKNFIGSKLEISKILIFSFFFILVSLPWQFYLAENEMILSSVIKGGYSSGYWDDGVAKYILGTGTKLHFNELSLFNHFFVPTAKNVVLFSESISSLKLFPFFLWIFVLFGLREINFNYDQILFLAVPLSTLAYLLFFIETRYLIAAAPVLSSLAGLGYINILNSYNMDLKKYYLLLILIMVFMDFSFGLLWLF